MPDNPNSKADSPDLEMPLSEHLRELRNRIFVCLAVLLAAAAAGFTLAPRIVELLLDIGRSHGYRFVYIAPQELLLQYVSTALICGFCAAVPILFYEAWAFVKPGLRRQEKGLFLFAIVFGLICFCGGVYFAFRIMLPFMLYFLISLSGGSSASPSISVQSYVSFLTTVFLIFGVVFELPVLSVLLNRIGILKARWMR
ncbi:MAG: twin-arginine translocase subunit TatC, partial [Oscillibacter sp.]|nr:twin-arginine translocase subunit TatC [Oscillibacter sp.]